MARATSIQFWNVTPRSVKGAASQLPTGNSKAMKELFRGRLCDWADVGLTGGLSLTLADLGSVGESVLDTSPDMAGNFYTVSARPRHGGNLMMPYFAADCCNGVAEGEN